MNLTLLLLKTGTTLVAQTEELEAEPRVHMLCPMEVTGKTKLTLTPWPPHTDDEHILIDSSSLLTIATPNDKLVKAYNSKVDVKPTPSPPVLLQEGETVPEGDMYEPMYIEEDI